MQGFSICIGHNCFLEKKKIIRRKKIWDSILCNMSCVTFHLWHVICHMWHVSCHKSLTISPNLSPIKKVIIRGQRHIHTNRKTQKHKNTHTQKMEFPPSCGFQKYGIFNGINLQRRYDSLTPWSRRSHLLVICLLLKNPLYVLRKPRNKLCVHS